MKLKKQKIILFINTAVPGEVSAGLSDGKKITHKKAKGNSDKLLVLVDQVLRANKIGPESIGGIAVISGPGSFTAVRQGIVATNALGFLLRIRVVGIRIGEFKNDRELFMVAGSKMVKARVGETVLPFYGGKPNITKPKD